MLQRHKRLAFAGSIHFITTVARIRGPRFVVPVVCRELLGIFEWYRARFEVTCLGYVLMPDHLHALLLQDDDEPIVPRLVRGFKSLSSRRLWHERGKPGTLWHYRYDDVPVPGSEAAQTKLQYMHANPVRAGIVERAEEYPWSSATDYVLNRPGIVTVARW